MHHVVGPGAVPVRRHLVNDPATERRPAGGLTDAPLGGGAKHVALAVPGRGRRRIEAIRAVCRAKAIELSVSPAVRSPAITRRLRRNT